VGSRENICDSIGDSPIGSGKEDHGQEAARPGCGARRHREKSCREESGKESREEADGEKGRQESRGESLAYDCETRASNSRI